MEKPWTNTHQPQKISEVVGQDPAIASLKEFVSGFKKNSKAAILYGMMGCGKTCSAHAIANSLDYEILEINASDVRNKDRIKSIIGSAISQQSLFSKGKIILIDEIDGISGTKDRGGILALSKLIDKSSFPIIMTTNDPWNKKFKPLKKLSTMIEFQPLLTEDIFNALKNICNKEKVRYDENALRNLARFSGGDLRAAVNDLQSVASTGEGITKNAVDDLGERNRTDDIENALLKVFKTLKPEIALSAFDSVAEDFDARFLWIDENLPKEYRKPEDLARAYDMLSKADVYMGRIRRWQHWRFLVYVNALLSAGIAVAKKEKYKEIIKYEQTRRLLKIWMANMKYMKRKSIAEKIAKATHSSSNEVLKDTLPYMQKIFQKNKKMADSLAAEFDLGHDETAWLKKTA